MTRASESYSVFVYQYRDAGNYKAPGVLLLRGAASPGSETAIRDACDSENYFVAEQVAVPTLYAPLYRYSGGPIDDDVAFHEFEHLRDATPQERRSLTPWGQLHDLVNAFQAVRAWNCELSPHSAE